MSKLDNDFLVFTNHDKDAKFESFTTFYIPASVLVIGTSEKPEFSQTLFSLHTHYDMQ